MGFTDERGAYHPFYGQVRFGLSAFRIATSGGDVGVSAIGTGGAGGNLASDSAPSLIGSGSLITQEIVWASSSSIAVVHSADLPPDFDGRSDVRLEMWVGSGTTDLASFTVATSWDGGATVTDTFTDTGASATIHRVQCIIAAADIPDTASFVSLLLTPAAHTTNAIALRACRMLFTPLIG